MEKKGISFSGFKACSVQADKRHAQRELIPTTGSARRPADFLMKSRGITSCRNWNSKGPSSRLIRMKALVHRSIVQKSEAPQRERIPSSEEMQESP